MSNSAADVSRSWAFIALTSRFITSAMHTPSVFSEAARARSSMVARSKPRGLAQAGGRLAVVEEPCGRAGLRSGPHTPLLEAMPVSSDLCLACAYARHAIGKPPRWLTLMTFVG